MPDKHEVGGSTPLEPTTISEADSCTFAKAKATANKIRNDGVGEIKNVH